MPTVTIPNRPIGTDIKNISQIVADFDAVLSAINGNLESSLNVRTASGATLDGNANAEGSSASLARADHKHLIQGVERLAADPASGNFVGRVFFNTTLGELRICTNAAGSGTWRTIMRAAATVGAINSVSSTGAMVATAAPTQGQFLTAAGTPPMPAWTTNPATEVPYLHALPFKPSDTSRASTTALAADPHLTFGVSVNEIYVVEGLLIVNGAGGDFNMDFAIPAGASGVMTLLGPTTTEGAGPAAAVALKLVTLDVAAATTAGTLGTANDTAMRVHAIISVAGTSGTISLRWAQDSSAGTATILRKNSYLKVTRAS